MKGSTHELWANEKKAPDKKSPTRSIVLPTKEKMPDEDSVAISVRYWYHKKTNYN